MSYASNMGVSELYQVEVGYVSGTTSVPPILYVVAADESSAATKALDMIANAPTLYNGGATNGEYVAAVRKMATATGTPAYVASQYLIASA